jgi:hypothetical protein
LVGLGANFKKRSSIGSNAFGMAKELKVYRRKIRAKSDLLLEETRLQKL